MNAKDIFKGRNREQDAPANDNVAEGAATDGSEAVNDTTAEDAPEATGSDHEKQVSELNDKYLRLYAEFDNYKRRSIKERTELMQMAGKDVFVAILPTLDDVERAIRAAETAKDLASVQEGLKLVDSKLRSALAAKGLKEIDAMGKVFDTDYHEAVTNIAAPAEDMKGKVLDVVEKGYTLNDKVVRFAKVVVGA